jgi:hypothetical protein
MSLRKVTSLTVLLSFAALAFTGAFTYLAPRGPGSSQWQALGLGKHEWFALHTNLGLLFLAAGIVHTILNIKPLISYLRNKQRKLRVFTLDFNLALLLTVWVVIGSLLNWAPFNAIRHYKEGRGDRSRHQPEAVEPPGPSIPEKPPLLYSGRTLASLCDKYDLEADSVVQRLNRIGIDARADWSIRQIAETNDMEPLSVFDAIRQVHSR